MKFGTILIIFCATALAYEDIDENEHFEILLKEPDELRKQLYCYLDRGPCSELAASHKRHMKQSITEACQHCTDNHKHNIHLFADAATRTFPELYKELENKYDPEGKFFKHFLEVVKTYY